MAKHFFSYYSAYGVEFHETAELARAAAEEFLTAERNEAPLDGWSDEVETICWGLVRERATKKNAHAPDPEEGESTDFDEICEYELEPVVSTEQALEAERAAHKATAEKLRTIMQACQQHGIVARLEGAARLIGSEYGRDKSLAAAKDLQAALDASGEEN